MRLFTRSLLLFLSLALALAGLAAAPSLAPTVLAQQPTPDDEIAFINAATNVQIVDPFTAAGKQPFVWTSPTSGYSDMAVLDANADGIEEIVAIGGNTARILNPLLGAVASAPAFESVITAGFIYVAVAAGDVVPNDGGRDEIILQRTDNRGGNGYSVQIWDGDNAGRVWQIVYDETFGVPWLRFDTGDYNGLAGDELVMVRKGLPPDRLDYRIKILSITSTGIFQTFAEQSYTFPWIDLAVGNTHINNGNLAEMVLTRDDVLGVFPSYLVFQYAPPTLIANAPGGQKTAFPPFFDIAVGDANASGDDEVFLIRDPLEGGSGISMIGLNYGSDPFPAAWENGLQLGRNLKAVTMGDVDGDARAEVVVAQSNSYRIWLDPATNLTTATDWISATFRDPYILRTGNFDGDGVSQAPPRLAVDKSQLQFSMLRGGANPSAQTFQVLNQGGGALAYTLTKEHGSAWFSVTPFEGTAPATHTVTIDGANLAPGEYNDAIIVTATTPNTENSPQRVNIKLTVTPTGPELGVSPASFTFNFNYGGVTPPAQNLTIRNIGDGGPRSYSLTITTTDGGAWLRASKTSGQTDDTVSVFVNPVNMRPGDYSGKIKVDAGAMRGSPVELPVTLKIVATGMVVSPNNLLLIAPPGLPSPRGNIKIDQAAPGQGAIHWYAYAVPSGDWWDLQAALAAETVKVEKTESGFSFSGPEGETRTLATLDWVILTPNNGFTPGDLQITVDVPNAPRGNNRVTILVDGGPGAPNRFQGVDAVIAVNNGGAWLPMLVR